MKLRPYQQECIDTIVSKGDGKYLCQLATGMGKTVIFANIPRFGNTLILSHRQELVMQPLKYFDCATAIEMGENKGSYLGKPTAEVTSASIQTMCRRFECYDRDAFHTVIIDEAHHAASESYSKVLKHFKPNRLIGFTATPNRADGQGLESVFDEIIFRKDLRWGIENGYLSPIRCKRVNIGYDLRGVAVRMGDYAPKDLDRAVNVDKCNDAIAEIVSGIAELPCLIFALDVKHAQAIAERIPGAVALSAESKNRAEVVEAYKRGEIPVLVNCALFTEGTDLPNTKTVIIARPTKSVGLYTQMVGRGTRLAEGKDHCLLIDCVGVSNLPLCTAPTLLGLNLDGVPERYQKEIEGDLLADIPELVERNSDTPESWINNVKVVNIWAKANGYVLHDINFQRRPNGTLYLRLPVEGVRKGAMVSITAPDLRGQVIFSTSGGFAEEMAAQDAYDLALQCLRGKFMGCRPLWSLSSAKRWGNVPATDKQTLLIRRLAKSKRVDVSGVMENLTKLQATSLIERLR
jgi:superfamily II DNA or RNA helicase